MGRVLVLVLLVVIAVWLVRRALRSGRSDDVAAKPPQEGDLVRCARCGTHVPSAEAKQSGGALFCSDEHARLGRLS